MSGDIAKALVDELYRAAPVPHGCRVNHARGLLVEGRFRASHDAARASTAPIFAGAEQPILVRFSSAGPDPDVAEDNSAAEPRGIAIRIGAEKPMVLVGHSLDGFPAADPETFLAFLRALGAAEQEPDRIAAHVAGNPAAQRFDDARARATADSFARLTYHMLHSYRLTGPDGQARIGRLTIVGDVAASAEHEGRNRLERDMRGRLAAGPVPLHLDFVEATSEDVRDITRPVRSACGATRLGTLILDRIATDQDRQRSLVFDPSDLTAGITFAGDAMIDARLRAYQIAAARRTGQHHDP